MLKRRLLHRLSVRSKLILAYAPVVFLAISLCFFYFSQIVNRQTIRQICSAKVTTLKTISDNVEYTRQNIVNISNAYLFEDDVAQFVRGRPGESAFEQVRRTGRVEEILLKQKSVFSNMNFYTTICSLDGQRYITNSPFGSPQTDHERVRSFTGDGERDTVRLTWNALREYNGYHVVSAYRTIIDLQSGAPTGMMIFDFDDAVFSKTYGGYVEPTETLLLLNAQGQTLSSSRGLAGQADCADSPWFSELPGYSEGYFFSDSVDGMRGQACVAFVKLFNPDWYLVSITPRRDLLQALNNIPQSGMVIALLMAGVLLGMTVLLSGAISRPIIRLTRSIASYGGGKPLPERDALPKGDEIVYLSQQYDLMRQRTDDLIERIVEEQESKRQFEMQALQSQINPHFIYNTLNVIRLLNKTGDGGALDKTIQALARILHSVFRSRETSHTVREEIEGLRDYLLIQQTRYGGNFTASFECPPEVLECTLAKMLVQPIVENAVFHGVSGCESGGKILIRFACREGFLWVEVEDNGPGFPGPDAQPDSRELQALKVHNGIGLSNTRERLRLIYGPQADVLIDSAPGAGSLVSLRIPQRPRKEK